MSIRRLQRRISYPFGSHHGRWWCVGYCWPGPMAITSTLVTTPSALPYDRLQYFEPGGGSRLNELEPYGEDGFIDRRVEACAKDPLRAPTSCASRNQRLSGHGSQPVSTGRCRSRSWLHALPYNVGRLARPTIFRREITLGRHKTDETKARDARLNTWLVDEYHAAASGYMAVGRLLRSTPTCTCACVVSCPITWRRRRNRVDRLDLFGKERCAFDGNEMIAMARAPTRPPAGWPWRRGARSWETTSMIANQLRQRLLSVAGRRNAGVKEDEWDEERRGLQE